MTRYEGLKTEKYGGVMVVMVVSLGIQNNCGNKGDS